MTQCTAKAKRTGNLCRAPAIRGKTSSRGTTFDACHNLGLDFVVIELSEHYADVAREWLKVA